MQSASSKCIAAAVAIGVVATASSAAQAHHRKWHGRWHRPPDHFIYDYSYFPIIGYSFYGNCYLVENFAPYRPYLVRVCPAR
jgi:hypothetical protein